MLVRSFSLRNILNEDYICILFTVSVNNAETNAQSEGPEKELLVNINCPLKLILNYIRDEVGLDGPSERNIFSANPIDYESKEESFSYC